LIIYAGPRIVSNCLYKQQILIDFRNSFIVTLSRKCAVIITKNLRQSLPGAVSPIGETIRG